MSFALVLFGSNAEAQTVTVTFNLNMANETVSPDGPHLAGGADFGAPGDNPNPIPGCTYPNASNFLEIAKVDDGSCVYPGCMDSSAINYSPHFTEDDAS